MHEQLEQILMRECDRMRSTPEGARNETLNTVIYTLGGYAHLGMPEMDAREAITHAALAAGLDASEISRTWASAWDKGTNNPCTMATPKKHRAYEWDEDIPETDLRIIDPDFLEKKDIHEPDAGWDGVDDLIRYIDAVFRPDEYVGYCLTGMQDAQKPDKYRPATSGLADRTAAELIALLRKCDGDIGKVLGDPDPQAGAWIRINPMQKKQEGKDADVTDFRHALVESDDGDIERQKAIYDALQLPCAAQVYSGNKSLHAIVRIDAEDRAQWKDRVKYLYNVLEQNGLEIDRGNSNPSRYSRLPGVTRNDQKQYLVATHTGCADWQSWHDHIEEVNDELPDFEPMFTASMWDDPPEMAPEIIRGILRQGHKMLVSGASKAGKSFMLLELAIAFAEGSTWLGYQCEQGKVIYVNFELDKPSCQNRMINQYRALGYTEFPAHARNIIHWPLRGCADAIDKIMPKLIRRAKAEQPMAVIIDPIYKVLNGDENSAHEMALFCNQFDKLCTQVGCAAIYCHHHSKGEQGHKTAHERASGSGVFSRDPDAILDLIELRMNTAQRQFCIDKITEHRGVAPFPALSAWRIEGTLREFPPVPPTALFYDYPLHYHDQWELTSCMTAPGESRGTSVSDQIVHAAPSLGYLGEGIPIDDITGATGLTHDAVLNACRSSSDIGYSLFDERVRSKDKHIQHMLIHSFRACSQDGSTATKKEMAAAMKASSTNTLNKWLARESAIFGARERGPVTLTDYGREIVYGNEDDTDDDEPLF